MARLNASSLSDLPSGTVLPAYDRDQPIGVVHLGIGAFHRAHQAAYFDGLLALQEPGWMIQAASLRSPRVAEQLNPQDGLYTMVVRDGEHERFQVIGSVRNVLVAPENPAALIAAMAQESVSLVTLTVTEKGYCIDPATGALNINDQGVANDIANIDQPITAPGFLVAGLRARKAANLPPFTVLSCDNLPENGQRTRQAVIAMAEQIDPGLAKWIETEGAFPSSMVDRIVPATTEQDLAKFETSTGLSDQAMVKTEPFTQWVVEDWFVGRRPPLEKVGVQITKQVSEWEKAKLRLLNGAHSAIAYLGGLSEHEFVHEAMAAPGFAEFVNALWDEAEATLPAIEGFDPKLYRADLTARFENRALQHRTYQIAMDGSQKLPQRFLNSIRAYRRKFNRIPPALTLGVAAWMRWQGGKTDSGKPFIVDDPLAAQTQAAVEEGVSGFLRLRSVFGDDLPNDSEFVTTLEGALQLLDSQSAERAVALFAETTMAET